jgi:hypothetical protein
MATDGERPLRPIKIIHIEVHRAGIAKPAPGASKPSS